MVLSSVVLPLIAKMLFLRRKSIIVKSLNAHCASRYIVYNAKQNGIKVRHVKSFRLLKTQTRMTKFLLKWYKKNIVKMPQMFCLDNEELRLQSHNM